MKPLFKRNGKVLLINLNNQNFMKNNIIINIQNNIYYIKIYYLNCIHLSLKYLHSVCLKVAERLTKNITPVDIKLNF